MSIVPLLAAFLIQVAPHEHLATPPAQGIPDTPPLYENLGTHRFPITTDSPRAQAYFDQGIRLYYAFNHEEAIRSFREAQRLDPTCAMCWWGEALALGPNINLPMDHEAGRAAWHAVSKAQTLLDSESPLEHALVDALATRYTETPPDERAELDSAFARAMEDVTRRFPGALEARVLFAEALMDLSPWRYWNEDGSPRARTSDLLDALEHVMERAPDHPGACHFLIHAVEAVDPDRAVPCAERLASLMPGAGHLVHMPGHIYIRVGRYADAIAANEHAVHADERWIADQRPGLRVYTLGYYPHNYDFLAFAAAMAGRKTQALAAADRVRELIPEDGLARSDLPFLQHWWARPLQMRIRFELWDEILSDAPPPAAAVHARALWHYARGRALLAQGRTAAAALEADELERVGRDPRLEGLSMEFNTSTDLLAIAWRVLEGLVSEARGATTRAIALLQTAARFEDALVYGEPPEWSIPVRQDLGALLLRAGHPDQAEQVYREDLSRFRDNGWSLSGLAVALRAQGKHTDALEADRRFREAWKGADVNPPRP